MRLRKRKQQPGMPPSQVEALGRCTPAEFRKASVITDALLAAQGGTRSRGVPAPPGGVPLLIGGESPQIDPTRESSSVGDSIVLDRNGNPVIRPGIRCIAGQKVGIDWVSCVFEPSASWMYFFASEAFGSEKANDDGLAFMEMSNDNKRVAEYVKDVFAWVLGLKVDETVRWKIYEKGLNGYKYAVGMPHAAGLVHVGHTSGTVLVTISGQGALVSAPGWEHRLYQFLKNVKGWLTRIDMAYDDYDGKLFPVRVMRERAREGAFARGGRPPKIELRGAWEQDDPTNSGLTLYIGSRTSGKFTRLYEKGKQLGDEASPWVRAEVELHNSCYQLTLEMLLKPTQWFAACYPCFEAIQTGGNRQELEYRQRIAIGTLEQSQKWIRHQAGGHLAALRQLYTDTELLDILCRPEAIPEAFRAAEAALQNQLAPSACLTDEPGWIEAGE